MFCLVSTIFRKKMPDKRNSNYNNCVLKKHILWLPITYFSKLCNNYGTMDTKFFFAICFQGAVSSYNMEKIYLIINKCVLNKEKKHNPWIFQLFLLSYIFDLEIEPLIISLLREKPPKLISDLTMRVLCTSVTKAFWSRKKLFIKTRYLHLFVFSESAVSGT